MARTEYAELEIRTWEEALADALEDLESPPSALRAWSAVGMIRCFKELRTPGELRRKEPVLRGCGELATRNPEVIVSRAVESEGEAAEERRRDLWFRWSADAAGLSAMKQAVTELGFPLELANPLEKARETLHQWERAIRCRWHELAPYGLDLAASQVGSWREAGGFADASLFLELLDYSRADATAPGTYRVCPWGFGEGDASDHAFLAEPESEFANHLGACVLCRERVRACRAGESEAGVEGGRIIPLRRVVRLAAGSGDKPWRVEVVVADLGWIKVWLNPDGVLGLTAGQFDRIGSVHARGVEMQRLEEQKAFVLELPGVSREEIWQTDIRVLLTDGGEPIVLRNM
ncbi:MAG: hypothetical protein V2A76_13735 [Planctomycetota bacterium]